MISFYVSIIISVVAIIFAGISFFNIKKRKIKDKKVKEISGVIYDGTRALFKKECGALIFLLVLVGAFLYFAAGDYMTLAFFIGAIFSIFVGNLIARVNILIDSRGAE
jgi:Na+/H+-translocating membrane pyrophosphatase